MRKKNRWQAMLDDAQENIQRLQVEVGRFPVACCCRCSHWWMTRTGKPKKCPKCKSKYWATKRKNRQGMRPGVRIITKPTAEGEACRKLLETAVTTASGGTFQVTLKWLAKELGMSRSSLKRYALGRGIKPTKIRTPETRGQLTLAVSDKEAEAISQSFVDDDIPF